MPRVTLGFALAVVLMSGANARIADEAFETFKAKYNKKYTAEEEPKRRAAFAANMAKAELMAHANPHATFGENKFADMSVEEFKVMHNADAQMREIAKKHSPKDLDAELVKKVQDSKLSQDWREKGAVTPVKNQGACGSCWSFSTTGNIEGQWKLAGNPLVSLSEQELVSCDPIDHGCQGGMMMNTFAWLLQARKGLITSEDAFSYQSFFGAIPMCLDGLPPAAQISNFVDVKRDEDNMGAFVYAYGPLSVAVDATSWQSYTGGVLTNCVEKQIDHAVLIVGFDDTAEIPYWIVKNSWGPEWGEGGYIRVRKGTNQCLITTVATSSIVERGTTLPPSPPPPPAREMFTTEICMSTDCSAGCHSFSNPSGGCAPAPGAQGLYGVATCGVTTANYTIYADGKCTVPLGTRQMPLDKCMAVPNGKASTTYSCGLTAKKQEKQPEPRNLGNILRGLFH